MNEINPPRTEELIQLLVALWEQSVQASHHFLTSDNIEQLTPFVKIGVSSIETLVVKYDADRPIAFMGIDHDKIEMLFVLPLYFGQGIGKELVMYALENYNVKYVDVNEQNPAATGFYEYLGFTVFERTALDEQGNPFPILKMKVNDGQYTTI